MADLEFDGGYDGSPCYVGLDPSYMGFGMTIMNVHGAYRTLVHKSSGAGIIRLLGIEKWLVDHLNRAGQIKDVAVESPVFHSNYATQSGELFAIILRALWTEFELRPMEVAPTSLKKFVTGKGRAEKSLVMMSVLDRYGVKLTNDNAADSYVLARIAAGDAQTKFQREVLNLVKANRPKGLVGSL